DLTAQSPADANQLTAPGVHDLQSGQLLAERLARAALLDHPVPDPDQEGHEEPEAHGDSAAGAHLLLVAVDDQGNDHSDDRRDHQDQRVEDGRADPDRPACQLTGWCVAVPEARTALSVRVVAGLLELAGLTGCVLTGLGRWVLTAVRP